MDIEFLKDCRDHDLVPVFLQFKLSQPRLQKDKDVRRLRQRLLEKEIASKSHEAFKATNEVNRLKKLLQEHTSLLDSNHLIHYANNNCSKKMDRLRSKHVRKLFKLKSKQRSNVNMLDPSKVIFNYSSVALNNDQKRALVKGLSFSIPPKKFNYPDYMAEFECLYKDIHRKFKTDDVTRADRFKCQLKNLALSTFYKYNSSNPQSLNPLTRAEFRALKSLKENHDILILKPDKGNGVVILDKSDYITKVEQILSDTEKFGPTKYDDPFLQVNFLQEKLRTLLRDLCKKGSISSNQYDLMYPQGTQLGIMYGTPKVHKAGCPVRPILSSINTPTYKLAKFLVKYLQPVSVNKFTCKDTFHFVKEINSIHFKNSYMVSFDVVSLFTNIPLDETIDICMNRLYHENITSPPDIPEGDFRILLERAAKGSCFMFNGKLYMQLDGVAMGSPLGPVLANIFLCHMEEKFMIKNRYFPLFYRRYVDDTFALFKTKRSADLFFQFLNTLHPSIKFTMDVEEDCKLNFLDTVVDKNKGNFTLDMYRKSTFTGQYVHWDSLIPLCYKIGLVKSLLCRAYSICTGWQRIKKEFDFIRTCLTRNGFPHKVFDQCIDSFLSSRESENDNHSSSVVTDTVDKLKVFIKLPFIGKDSVMLKKNLLKITREYSCAIDLQVVFKAGCTVANMFPYKDRMPHSVKSFVVYKIQCEACDASYIGKTTQRLAQRNEKAKSGSEEHAFKEHTRTMGENHKFQLDDVQILASEPNPHKLLVKESLSIRNEKPSLNKDKVSVPLHLF